MALSVLKGIMKHILELATGEWIIGIRIQAILLSCTTTIVYLQYMTLVLA